MPQVGNKHYPYTPKGIAAAKREKEKRDKAISKAGGAAGAAALGGAYWTAARDRQVGIDADAEIKAYGTHLTDESKKAYKSHQKQMGDNAREYDAWEKNEGKAHGNRGNKKAKYKQFVQERDNVNIDPSKRDIEKVTRGKWVDGKFKPSTIRNKLLHGTLGYVRLPRLLTRGR